MGPGTITDLQPQDGLGWITLDSGERVRFGSSACRNVVIEIGRRVNVLGTAPGYGGAAKATAVVELNPPAPAEAAPSYLAKLDALPIRPEPWLREIVQRADSDRAFYEDLQVLGFEVEPMLADELDCHAPKFFVIAMNGGGSAFGLYDRGNAAESLPWVFWEHEDDSLRFVAKDMAEFFTRLLHFERSDPSRVERVRAVLLELGLPLGDPTSGEETFPKGEVVSWLPQGPLG